VDSKEWLRAIEGANAIQRELLGPEMTSKFWFVLEPCFSIDPTDGIVDPVGLNRYLDGRESIE
jgi:hypothetical protein